MKTNKTSALLCCTFQLAILQIITTTVRSMGVAARIAVAERTYSCSDGVRLAARHWSNFDLSNSNSDTRKILCLHGWLDNAASFNRLAPLLLDARSSSEATIPTEIVALDL